MPEGDTVWRAASRLDEALAGQTLTASDFRLPRLATVDLAGRVVSGVVSRGKHLLIRVEDDLSLHTHFRMDGSWHVYASGERWRGGAKHQVRVVLSTVDNDAVGYRLHDVEVLPTAEEYRLVGHLGPDLLGADWDLAEAVRRLTSAPDHEIGDALLDQRNLAGIGNLYKSEVLFLRGISPWTPVRDVADLEALVVLVRRLLQANKDHWEQATTGSTRRGEQHWVFERPGRPCRRCGSPIRVASQGVTSYERLSYWCAVCQPGPVPPGAHADADRWDSS